MRIATVTTSGERDAVLHAAEAAEIVLSRFPSAQVIQFAAEAIPGSDACGVFAVRGAEATTEPLWLDIDDTADAFDGDTQARVRSLLAAAGAADTRVFEPGEVGSAMWRLRLHCVLDADAVLAARRLADHADIDLGLAEDALDELVHEVASQQASRAYNNGAASDLEDDAAYEHLHRLAGADASAANNNGRVAQTRFLLGELGERETWIALESE